jgi:lipopolysaccharide export system permease protein
VLIVSIAIVFDLSEKMDEFIDKGAPLKAIIFNYYLNFIPYFANMFSSLFVFISVIFFTTRMASKSEFIAMFSSGISLNRLLYPYFIAATIITAFSFILGNYVIPDSNRARLEFQANFLRNRSSNIIREYNMHRQLSPGVYFYVEYFDGTHNEGRRMTLEKFDGVELVSKLTAELMIWDTVTEKWNLKNCYIRNFYEDDEEIIVGKSIDTAINITPDEFVIRLNDVEAKNRKELNEYIEEQRLSGTSAVISSEIEKHSRIASPFATFILTIIGFSLSVRKVKGALGVNIILGLLLSFSYILFMKFSRVFALAGIFNVAFSMWIPNILYSIIAIIIYIKIMLK